MTPVVWPAGFVLQRLRREHPRKLFQSGEQAVDDWLATKALQHQEKNLSVSRVLIDPGGRIAGYYSLATGQVEFGDLPAEMARRLPRRSLPVAVLAWLGVDFAFQKNGLGKRLFAQALLDCHAGGQVFAFVAVIIDCLSEAAKAFYEQWGCRELPGHPNRLYFSAQQLEAMVRNP